MALNTLIQKYELYLLCATYFGAMVVDVTVFTLVVAVQNLTVSAYTIRKSIILRFFWYPTFVYSTCVCGDTAIPVVQRDKHLLGSYGNRDSRREVKGCGGVTI